MSTKKSRGGCGVDVRRGRLRRPRPPCARLLSWVVKIDQAVVLKAPAFGSIEQQYAHNRYDEQIARENDGVISLDMSKVNVDEWEDTCR